MKNDNSPVFYSKSQRRWRYSKRTIIAVVVFLVATFSVTTGSIIVGSALPQISLQSPDVTYRESPSIPKSSSSNTVASPLSQTTNIPTQIANTTRSNSKMLGFYVNWDDNSLVSLKQNIGSLDELVPEWLHLSDQTGAILVDDQTQQDKTIEFIKKTRPDLRIVPLINNYSSDLQDWDVKSITAMLASPTARTQTIANILDYVQKNNFSGISIDFESIPTASQPNLLLFMQELYGKFQPLKLEVSQNIPLLDNDFKASELGKYSDFLILMAYDENSVYSETAGPVASQNWFKSGLSQRFSELPANKYVVALGGYGYDWLDGQMSGKDLTFQDAVTIAKKANASVVLDAQSLNPTFDYVDENNNLHHIWFLDGVTTFDEMATVEKLGDAYGYALWRLGSEDPSIWKAIISRNNLDEAAAQLLQNVDYGYDIIYKNQGEILRITGTPHTGKRELTFDSGSGLIITEKMIDLPSSYVITRWGGADPKKIALTFDDGPDKKYTPAVLDILKKYNVPATFFVIGANASLNSSLVKKEFLAGCEIGSHTYTHPDITKISEKQVHFELDLTQRIIEGILGRKTLLFRPPYAEDIEPETPDQMQALMSTNQDGYYTVAMHIDPNDWSSPGVNNIVDSVINGAESGQGNVVLLHDGGGDRSQTIAALPQIIEGLKSRGFEIVSISDLVGVSRDNLMPPVSLREQALARANGLTVKIVDWFSKFMHFMFFVGIVLGVMRFIFIGTLAIVQWAHTRHGRYRDYENSFFPTVSVIIPAFNEEKVIIKTVRAILKSTYPNFNVLVIDDGSKDQTFELARKAFQDNPRVKVFTKENGGKSEALNFGIAKTDAEIVVTLDADTVFLSNTIGKLVRRFIDKRIWAVAGNAKVGNRINLLTRWQALEYITSQNLDRRAFEIMNCITVVPGAVGAWRRRAIIEAGGFSSSTLAEDADLTFAIIRRGHQVAYDDEALAYTEAPDNTINFVKQRFRWMYGTLQTIWKHKDTFLRKKYGALGFFSIPNVLVFQILFPLISPFMDLMMILSIIWAIWQNHYHPLDFSAFYTFKRIFFYYLFFLAIDLLTATIPFILEHRENWTLIIWLPLQRFYYRQLMYYVAIKATLTALKGGIVGWGKFERKATVTDPI